MAGGPAPAVRGRHAALGGLTLAPHPAAPHEGRLVAFEGLDQSGKQTQCERLRARLEAAGRRVEVVEFPDYATAISLEIERALRGESDYPPDVLQLLYIANRYEFRPRLERWLEAGVVVLCDRYAASSLAYGAAQGLDRAWLAEVQRFLPRAALTVLLDIAPETALARKAVDRDRFERDLPLLARVRAAYLELATADASWVVVDGTRSADDVTLAVTTAVRSRLALP